MRSEPSKGFQVSDFPKTTFMEWYRAWILHSITEKLLNNFIWYWSRETFRYGLKQNIWIKSCHVRNWPRVDQHQSQKAYCLQPEILKKPFCYSSNSGLFHWPISNITQFNFSFSVSGYISQFTGISVRRIYLGTWMA